MSILPDSTTVPTAVAAARRRVLLVTADDLGYAPERDAGIIRGFEHGVITQASVSAGARTTDIDLKEERNSFAFAPAFCPSSLCAFRCLVLPNF
jgi:hypothetical protein